MGGDDIAFAGAARQAEMVRAGEVSPRELVQVSLDRIQRLDSQLNAFRKVFDRIANGESDARIIQRKNDDFPEVAAAFNKMMDKLQKKGG